MSDIFVTQNLLTIQRTFADRVITRIGSINNQQQQHDKELFVVTKDSGIWVGRMIPHGCQKWGV